MSDQPTIAPTAGRTTESRTPGIPQLVVLLAASCLSVLGAVLLAPVLPQMTEHFADVPGAGVLVPIVLTVPSLIIGITAPFAGILADKVDRQRVLLIALIAYAIVGTAPLYLNGLPAIVGSRMLLGICEAAIMTCCTTLIGDYWTGARRAKYLGLQTLVAALGATIFLALGGVLGGSGWRTPFWVYFIPLLLVIPIAKLVWHPARPDTDPAGRDHLAPMPWRQLLGPCLVTLFGGLVFYALIVELSFVLTGIGVTSTSTIGGISAIMSLSTALGAVAFARLARLTPRMLLPIEFGLSAIGLVLVSLGSAIPLITIGAVFTGFGTGLLLPTLLTWAVNRLHFEQRGRGTGLWTGTLFIGQFLSPVLLAGIGAQIGGLQPALMALGIAAAVMAVVTRLAVRRNSEPLTMTYG